MGWFLAPDFHFPARVVSRLQFHLLQAGLAIAAIAL